MAKNSRSQKIGKRGETTAKKIFEDLGYVCNDISNDFGEDFFVLGEQDTVIEPFKIYVQVKASETFEKYPSDWTEYCDPFTVRNWILSNDLAIVIRVNLGTNEIRYLIPEDDCEYWEIDYENDVPIRLQRPFSANEVEHLVWTARLRHYNRLVKLTMPNQFESHEYQKIPRFRLYIYEFLVRLKIFDSPTHLCPDILELYKDIFNKTAAEIDIMDSDDMTRHEKLRYATCLQLVSIALQDISGIKLGLTPSFLDQCACLLVQFIIAAEGEGAITVTA